jgi:hypothetical protein
MKEKSLKLAQLAKSQGGFFTAAQAAECGFGNQNQHRLVKSGEWLRYMRGIYRLAIIPEETLSDYYALSLFFRYNDGTPSGVFSLESAMFVRNVGDFLPVKLQVAVQPRFRKRATIPEFVSLIPMEYSSNDFEEYLGFPIMKVLPTIIHMLKLGTSEQHLVKAAFIEARQNGLISARALATLLSGSNCTEDISIILSSWEKEIP